jgi:hypothetical protein
MEASTEETITVLFLADDLALRRIDLLKCVAPDLLVLDVKPVRPDAAVVNQVRSHPRLKDVPAILLSRQRPDKLSGAGFTLAPIR